MHVKSYNEAVRLVQQGKADILGFFPGSENDAIRDGLALSASYMNLNNIVARNKACNFPGEQLVGAVVEGQRLPAEIPAREVRTFTDITSALLAVNRGEVDFVYAMSSQMEQDLQRYHFSNLAPVILDNDQSAISFALSSPVDPDLLTVLNKAINNLSKSEKAVIRDRNLGAIVVSEFSLSDFIYANPVLFLAIVISILLILVTAVLVVARARM